jgi:hypothetical protein
VVAHCGPEPRDILNARLDAFFNNPARFEQFYDPAALSTLTAGVQGLREHFFDHELCRSVFSNLCGRSIRKTLLLAQHLIWNSVYDPWEVGLKGIRDSGIGIGDVLRAILVGTGNTYSWSPSSIIENIFQVQQHPGIANLLKLRILRMLARGGENGVQLNQVYTVLRGFGYNSAVICSALNELTEQPRRLIWSDAVQRRFEGEADLARLGQTRLSLSSVGWGYNNYLFHNIDYIQEIMLDTTVGDEFGSGWEYHKMEDRFVLVYKFLSYLAGQERRETARFLLSSTADEYIHAFGTSRPSVLDMLRSVRAAVERILDSIVASRGKSPDGVHLRDLRNRQLADYDARITEMENLQSEISTLIED